MEVGEMALVLVTGGGPPVEGLQSNTNREYQGGKQDAYRLGKVMNLASRHGRKNEIRTRKLGLLGCQKYFQSLTLLAIYPR